MTRDEVIGCLMRDYKPDETIKIGICEKDQGVLFRNPDVEVLFHSKLQFLEGEKGWFFCIKLPTPYDGIKLLKEFIEETNI